MMRSRIRLGVGLALVTAALLLPTTTWAQGRSNGGGAGRPGNGVSVGRPGFNGNAFRGGNGFRGSNGFRGGHGHGGKGFHGHGFHKHRFNNSVVFVGPSPFWYSSAPFYASPPVVYSPPPVYVAPQFVYQAPPSGGYYPAAPSAPPGQRVVEFPTGRYELRGDGITQPYTWVWIPNPPSAPPEAPPAPTAPPSESGAPAGRPAPTRAKPSGPIYRWTDDNGVTTITDDVNKVPERYRADLVNRTRL